MTPQSALACPPNCMSLYTTNELFNGKEVRFSLYHCTTFSIDILVMPSHAMAMANLPICTGMPTLYVSIYHQ